jgi:hypothetical protein
MLGEVTRLWAEEDLGWYQALRSSAAGAIAAPTGPAAITATPHTPDHLADSEGRPPARIVPAENGGAKWRRIWESTRPLDDERPQTVWPR